MTLKIPNTSGTNPSNIINYIVKKGDSLYSIAKKYDTTISDIKDLNNLKTNNLSIGQLLKIPEKNPGDISLPSFISYTVKKGDTLYSIAKENNISVDEIIKDNSFSNNNLSVGQILKIRTTEEIVEECLGPDYNLNVSNPTEYIVKKGDSLYVIANKYNTSVSNIMNLNNLSSTNLKIGQVLKIPNNSSSNTYVVQKGDSLYTISKKFNTTVDSIKKKNNLTSNLLSIGQKLII